MTAQAQWTLEPIAALARHAAHWDALSARAGDIPFLESRFLLPLLQEFPAPQGQLALCRDGSGTLIAAALLQPQGTGRWASYQPSQLPLGPWLVADGQDGAALAAALLRRLPGLALRLGLTQLDPRLTARPAAAPRLASLDYIDTAWVDVAGSFEAYWEARGKNLRSNMRKQRSKLQTEGVALSFERLVRPEDVDAAIAEYGRLESAGWKAESGTAVHPDNAQGRFYAAMLKAFCAAGRGEIWQLRFDAQVVAVNLCIRAGDTLVILKTAFDASQRTVSPAFLLNQEAFQQVFDEGRVARIEFYGRQMEWHTRWTEQARTLYHLNVDRWSWLPALQRLLRRQPAAAASTPTQAAAPAAGEQA
jgi:CelD/BcsL family acetyltransferase involved in cellulose biosynthesis